MFSIIVSDVFSIRLEWKVLIDPNVEGTAAGKAFTLYLLLDENNSPIISKEDLNFYLKTIADKLKEAGVREAESSPCDVKTIYLYITLRSCVENSDKNGRYFESDMAGHAWNPFLFSNPFYYLLSDIINNEEFDPVKHFEKFPSDTKQSLICSIIISLYAYGIRVFNFDLYIRSDKNNFLENIVKGKFSNDQMCDAFLLYNTIKRFESIWIELGKSNELSRSIATFVNEFMYLDSPLGKLLDAIH